MRRRSAHPQVLDRRLVLRPARYRAREEELLERQLALEDVALGQPEVAFEVEWRQHLPVQDDVADVRRVLRDRVDDGVAERLSLRVPLAGLKPCATAVVGQGFSPAPEVIWRVLHEARQD